MSAEDLCIAMMIVPLTGGMIVFDVDILTEVRMITALVAVFTLELVVLALYAIDL